MFSGCLPNQVAVVSIQKQAFHILTANSINILLDFRKKLYTNSIYKLNLYFRARVKRRLEKRTVGNAFVLAQTPTEFGGQLTGCESQTFAMP